MVIDILKVLKLRWKFFLELLIEHIQISLISIFFAIIIGLFIGFIISEYKKSSKIVLGVINSIYTIPSISLFGFLIPLSGIGNKTAIIALTVYALLPMVRNTYAGLTNINPLLVEAAVGMGSTKAQVLFKIKIPLAMPIIITGIRNMAVMTIALTGIASFIGAGGLGVAIYRGITTNNKAMTIIGSAIIAILAVLVDYIIGIVERAMKKHIN
ncbi:ABC transporter permease [Caviibacter abscessus]|uniref:ABC transporter permease n=1 Tax=Caviibacter abscessus TaxID=1766719 RepID=UPI000837EEC1|nr:ABC transporter permease [Caviibacter abscessus]